MRVRETCYFAFDRELTAAPLRLARMPPHAQVMTTHNLASLEIAVAGTPAAQGNHRVSQSGHVYETTKGHKPWRLAVSYSAMEARHKLRHMGGAFTGPVSVQYIFTVQRPKSAKKGAMPSKRPDLSKYVRSTEDSLTAAGIWADDSLVIHMDAIKVYPGQHPDALDVPGVVIRIKALGNAGKT